MVWTHPLLWASYKAAKDLIKSGQHGSLFGNNIITYGLQSNAVEDKETHTHNFFKKIVM